MNLEIYPLSEAVQALTRLRKQMKITQTELARRMGCLQHQISTLEAKGKGLTTAGAFNDGTQTPNVEIKTLEKYATALGLEFVVGLVETPAASPDPDPNPQPFTSLSEIRHL